MGVKKKKKKKGVKDVKGAEGAIGELKDMASKCFSNRSLCAMKLGAPNRAKKDAQRAILFSDGKWGKAYFRLGAAQEGSAAYALQGYATAVKLASSDKERKAFEREHARLSSKVSGQKSAIVELVTTLHVDLDEDKDGYLNLREFRRSLIVLGLVPYEELEEGKAEKYILKILSEFDNEFDNESEFDNEDKKGKEKRKEEKEKDNGAPEEKKEDMETIMINKAIKKLSLDWDLIPEPEKDTFPEWLKEILKGDPSSENSKGREEKRSVIHWKKTAEGDKKKRKIIEINVGPYELALVLWVWGLKNYDGKEDIQGSWFDLYRANLAYCYSRLTDCTDLVDEVDQMEAVQSSSRFQSMGIPRELVSHIFSFSRRRIGTFSIRHLAVEWFRDEQHNDMPWKKCLKEGLPKNFAASVTTVRMNIGIEIVGIALNWAHKHRRMSAPLGWCAAEPYVQLFSERDWAECFVEVLKLFHVPLRSVMSMCISRKMERVDPTLLVKHVKALSKNPAILCMPDMPMGMPMF